LVICYDPGGLMDKRAGSAMAIAQRAGDERSGDGSGDWVARLAKRCSSRHLGLTQKIRGLSMCAKVRECGFFAGSRRERRLISEVMTMVAGKWGESFLKSGLPLEHLTHVTFRDLNWHCTPQVEVRRPNRDGVDSWFEIDLVAEAPITRGETSLALLTECKYHDESRHWFFLPHLSDGRWRFDDRVLNVGPFPALKDPHGSTLLDHAPLSSGGLVVWNGPEKVDGVFV
jgi:hypothetical protein